MSLEPCPDCAAPVGALHAPGCDVECCPDCGGQMLSCGGHGRRRSRYPRIPWTGTWPGVAECREFGWYAQPAAVGWAPCAPGTPTAIEDLNRLHGGEAVWDPAAARWKQRQLVD